MSAAPFDVELVIQRLRDLVPELHLVEGAGAYAAIRSLADFRTPSAYVLLARERGDGEPPKNGRQRVLATFGVVLAVRNYRGQVGHDAMIEASPLVGRVRDALIGWQPAATGSRPCQWLQGDVLDYDASTLLWSDVFQTQHFIGGAP